MSNIDLTKVYGMVDKVYDIVNNTQNILDKFLKTFLFLISIVAVLGFLFYNIYYSNFSLNLYQYLSSTHKEKYDFKVIK
jgi:hypothetical protein